MTLANYQAALRLLDQSQEICPRLRARVSKTSAVTEFQRRSTIALLLEKCPPSLEAPLRSLLAEEEAKTARPGSC